MATFDTTKRYTVLGLGVTGQSVVRFLHAAGAAVLAVDENATVEQADALRAAYPGVRCNAGAADAECLEHTDVLVQSPGVPLSSPLSVAARERGIEIIGDVELFARVVCKPVIAVTGTNGKSTVVSMIGACGDASELNLVIGGNLGTPALDLIADDVDVYVLELSSYQLETTSSLAPAAAAVLNITPDHLDRYPGGLEDYVAAKQRIYTAASVCVAPESDLLAAPAALEAGQQVLRVAGVADADAAVGVVGDADDQWIAVNGEAVLPVAELGARGSHNLSNACFAVVLAQLAGVSIPAIRVGLAAFSGLPHRTQSVRQVGGVRFINDSKGTNVGATCTALQGMAAPTVLIAGGIGKSQDFSPLADALKGQGRALIVFGRDADLIAAGVAHAVPTHTASTLSDAVALARSIAQPGDTVLFSPACSSFDMFRNFEERGQAFIDSVEALSA